MTKKRLKETLLNFIDRTSINGLSDIYNNQFILGKIIWTLLFLGCLAYTIYNVVQAIGDYVAYEVTVGTKLTYVVNERITFPAIWMCYGVTGSQLSNASVKFENKEVTNYQNISLHDKICLVWNSGNTVELSSSKIAGSNLGADISLFFDSLASNEVSIFIGDNLVKPIAEEMENFPAELGYKLTVAISKFINNNLPNPYNDCLDTLSNKSFDSEYYQMVFNAGIKYRQRNCIEFCSLIGLAKTCNCSYHGFYEVNGGVNCLDPDFECFTQALLVQDVSECKEACPLECDNIQFTKDVVGYASDANRISLRVFFAEMSYTDVTQSPKSTLYDLVSTIGGVFGLFLGFSILSFAEILTLIIDVIAVIARHYFIRGK